MKRVKRIADKVMISKEVEVSFSASYDGDELTDYGGLTKSNWNIQIASVTLLLDDKHDITQCVHKDWFFKISIISALLKFDMFIVSDDEEFEDSDELVLAEDDEDNEEGNGYYFNFD